MDDPDPLPSLLALAATGPAVITIWSVALAWAVAFLAALLRAALEDTSRRLLLDPVHSSSQRARLEKALEEEDSIQLALGLVQLLAEAWFVLSLPHVLPGQGAGDLFGAPDGAARHAWSFGLAVLWLYPTVHALPGGLARGGRAEAIVRPILRGLHLLAVTLSPLTRPLMRLRGDGPFARPPEEGPKDYHTVDIIDAVSESERAGAINEKEAAMISRVLSLEELSVSEIMTPRTDLTCISVEESIEAACALAHAEGHSKIPVYRKNRDDVCGIFQLRDAIPALTTGDSVPALKDILQPAYFVPESKKAIQLLREFQQEAQGLAIVLDEYGGTAGLITVEDILEEIVGEIREEHDREEEISIQAIGNGEYLVDPRLRVEEVNEELHIRLPESEDYDTVAGFVFSHLDRIPDSNESFQYDNLHIQVLEVDNRRITRLKLRTAETE